MSETADVVNAVANLISVLGLQKSLLIVVVCFIFVMIMNHIKSKRERFYYESMEKSKTMEIQRLADDNRRYREVYLAKLGYNQDEIDKISAKNANTKGEVKC